MASLPRNVPSASSTVGLLKVELSSAGRCETPCKLGLNGLGLLIPYNSGVSVTAMNGYFAKVQPKYVRLPSQKPLKKFQAGFMWVLG